MRVDKVQKSIYTMINAILRSILAVIVAGLCLQSLYSTSFIGAVPREDGSLQERTLNIADDPWRHLIVFLLVTFLGCLCYRRYHAKKRASQEDDSIWPVWILSAVVLLLGTVWIMMTQLAPGSDPAKVYGIAMEWRRGNFSAYAEGGYLFRYPFQAGIILFYYVLSFFFGIDNYVGLQFINVLALLAVYLLLAKLSALFWKKDRNLPVVVYGALILWAPLGFYVTYLYGILPGMALSLGAVYAAAKYIDTGKYRYILPACVCMGLATVIKMNCLIYLIAIACFLFYDALTSVWQDGKGRGEKRWHWVGSLAAVVLMGLSVAACNRATAEYVEYLSGYEAGEGEAMLSWVVMGLQETPLGPGGYSGYIGDVFVKYDYDTEKIQEASLTDIKKILTRMSENILDEGVTFFARKNAFQWNDPTFISLDRTRGRTSAVRLSAFTKSLIEGRGSVVLSVALNAVQTLLLFGVLLYLILNRRSDNLYELMGTVVFLGGYLFHFVWESSASYTIPYFVVLIPYGVKGLADWIRYVAQIPVGNELGAVLAHAFGECPEDRKTKIRNFLRRNKGSVGVSIVLLALLLLFRTTNLFGRTIALDDGEEARAQFYQDHTDDLTAGILDGYYYVSPYTDQQKILAEEFGEVTLLSLSEIATDMSEILGAEESVDRQAVTPASAVQDIEHKLLLSKEKTWKAGQAALVSMRFRSNEQVLAVKEQEGELRLTCYRDDDMNLLYEPDGGMSYLWQFQPDGDVCYYITVNGMALACRNGALLLEEWNGCEEQRWILRQ